MHHIVLPAAQAALGMITRYSNHNGGHFNTNIVAMAREQRDLRFRISNCRDDQLKVGLKQNRNQLQDEIRQLVLKRANAILDARATEVEKHKDGVQMFNAMKQLIPRPKQALTVHNPQGRILTNNSCKVKKVSEWFQLQFSTPEVLGIRQTNIVKGPVTCPISEIQVENALHRLNNNHACGPDGIAGELCKYSAGVVSATLASNFNQALEGRQSLDLGQGTLIPLQTSGKPPGPLTSVRLIVLQSTIPILIDCSI